MPIYVTRQGTGPDGELVTLADRDTLAQLTGFSAMTIRLYCTKAATDLKTGRALYDQAAVEKTLADRGTQPRPHMQQPRAKRDGPAKRRRKP